jgi:Flp pilus assembly pilin Flp
MSQFTPLLRRFAKDESGVFAVLFGLMAIVLIALGGATVDYVTLEQTRSRAQVALDAAVLALQPDIYLPGMTTESIRARAEAIVLERIGDIDLIDAKVDRVSMDLEAGRLLLGGDFTVRTLFVSLVGVTQLSAAFSAEAVRGAVDIEVAVALDVTGSMAGQRIIDLRSALNDLIDAVVQDTQTPNYSKMALIPYSQAVNAGTYATAIRGPITAAKGITGVTWTSGTTRSISGITQANPAVVTANGHGFNNGDWVYIWDVGGMGQVNNRAFQVANRSANTFQLSGVNSSGYSWYWWGGQVRKCDLANCALRVTSNNHGYSNGQYLHITDVGGMTGINNQTFQVASTTTNTVTFSGTPSAGASGTYTANTGNLHCTWQTAAAGCTYYRFTSPWGNVNTFAVTNCVTERVANPFNDQPPTVTFAGRNYPPSGNACPNHTIVPLTTNKVALHATADGLTAAGSTSGSLGTLWSWYMLSPNFGYIWPAGSQPAPYGQQNLLKAAIIMTDGDYNTVHCNGALAQNSGNGSGGVGDQINCDAPNGNSDTQARAYCDAMKATGIVVYTVGFGITAGSAQANLLTYCASSAANAYLASNGAALAEAFEQIARNISSLRLTL